MEKKFDLQKVYKNCIYAQKILTERNRGALISPFNLNTICYYAYKSNLKPVEVLTSLGLEYALNNDEISTINNAYNEYEKQGVKENLTCAKVSIVTKDKFCSECCLKECLQSHADFYTAKANNTPDYSIVIPKLDIKIIPIKFLQELLCNIQENINAPIEYILISLLTVLGAVIGLNFSLKLDDTWNIYSSLLSVLIGEPSSKKSPSMKVFTDILHQVESETNVLMSISNTTVEGICKFMSDNKKAVLIACDELKGWLNSLGEYKGKTSSDRQFYLSAWNCERYVSLRKTSSNIIIQNTHVSLLGSTQPQILKDMFKCLNTGDGFIERLLWIIPADYQEVGKYIGRGKGKVDKNKIATFKGILREIITFNSHKEYSLDSEGEKLFDDFEKELKTYTINNPKYSALYGKSEGLAGKLVLIFQVFNDIESRNYDNNIVDTNIIKGSIELTKYFINQFKAVIDIFTSTVEHQAENIDNIVYNWLLGRPDDTKLGFSPSLISTYKVGKIFKADEAKNVLESLLDKGKLAFNPITKKYLIISE